MNALDYYTSMVDALTDIAVYQMAECVHTENTLSQTTKRTTFWDCQFRINVVKIPLERFALQSFTQLKTVVNATYWERKRKLNLFLHK